MSTSYMLSQDKAIVLFIFSSSCGYCPGFKNGIYREILSKLYPRKDLIIKEYTFGAVDNSLSLDSSSINEESREDRELSQKMQYLPYPGFFPCMIIFPKIIYDNITLYPIYEVAKTVSVLFGSVIIQENINYSPFIVLNKNPEVDKFLELCIKHTQNYFDSSQFEYRNQIKKKKMVQLYDVSFIRSRNLNDKI